MKLLFHLHTRHSYDSMVKPRQIISYALKNGIDALAITDHGNMKGSLEARHIVKKEGLPLDIIPGAEYFSDCGDIIGLFLSSEINEFNALRLIDKIHEQGGLAILPHPYYKHSLSKQLIEKTDLIEVFNPRCSQEQNKKAEILAKKYHKPLICGNDAHLQKELALCYNTLQDNLNTIDAFLADKNFSSSYTSRASIVKSQMIKGVKTRKPGLVLKMVKSLISIYFIQPLRALFR